MKKQPELIEKIADKITALNLNTPAVLILEAHKPLAFIGSQLLLIAQPTLNVLFPRNSAGELANLLGDSTQLERLITVLESRAASSFPPRRPANDG